MKWRNYRSATFNMVEIVLALVIIVIGIIGVMALFPVAQQQHRDAVGTNNAQDAAEQFLRVFSSKIKDRWALIAALPQENLGAEANEAEANWENADSNAVFHDIRGLKLYYNDEDGDDKFDFAIGEGDLSKDDSGLFKLVQESAGGVQDFSAVLRVWHAPAMYKSYNVDGGFLDYRAVNRERGVQINVELSWPAEIPYERRETARYSEVVFRPTEENVEEVRGAFAISEAGTIRFRYYGSEAGYMNGFWMLAPDEVEVFHSQVRGGGEQDRELEMEFEAGTSFNFYAYVQPNWNNASTNWRHYAWADPRCSGNGSVGGRINVNPNNNDDFEFELEKPDGSIINRDDLLDSRGNLDYDGPAVRVRFKPKGNGNQNGLVIDGQPIALRNGQVYTLTSTDMTLHLYNDRANSNGRAMGRWWMDDIAATNGVLEGNGQTIVAGQTPDDCDIPYYDSGDSSNRNGAYCKRTGNPYCVVTELIPGRKWLMGFEDVPGYYSWTDWDYNDIVVSAELNPRDGVVEPSLGGHDVEGRIGLQASGHRDWRVTIVKPDGDAIETGNLGSGYDGPAIAIWARPQGSGSQTITVDGNDVEWNNANMIVISSYDMDLDVRKVSGKWVVDVDASEADFSIMN